ncbi:putative phosphoenolpyruvate synthase isoform X2 [Argiope bruennichi]|nr:putative phosphoenolpyruvate synthase isoform X2 [Argiope bruennichi]
MWIHLKLFNGDEFILPGGPDLRTPYIDSDGLFYACGLQIRCLSPMRKWRISFNGLLQQCNSENNDKSSKKIVHVKFSFIWLSIARGRETNIDFSCKDLATAFANASHNIDFKDLKCFYAFQNRYEQWGQLMGTVCVKGKEEELYLWCCKTRISDRPLWHEDVCFANFYIYFKDGYPLSVETTTIKNFISNYTYAHSIAPTGGLEDVTNCNFDLNVLQRNYKKLAISFDYRKKKHRSILEFNENEKIVHLGPDLEWTMTIKSFKVISDNGDEGYGVLHFGMRSKEKLNFTYNAPPVLLIDKRTPCASKNVVLLNEDECKNSAIAGGKGCSLALLSELSEKERLFYVPKGFVVTTSAFENHIKNNKTIYYGIKQLVNVSGEKAKGDLKDECNKCVEEFQSSKMSDSLKAEIQEVLLYLYESVEHIRFSIRSSACGEDSEDLSAAGQMLTVLGVRGINNIADAIIKCWSSKFGYEAVQYARQNGQSIESSMAVVVQEMVPSEVSGVLFTVDPVTGDPSNLCITANYGLGETVVSSLAEPDTFILQRLPDNTVLLKEKTVGTKKTEIHMHAEEGTLQKTLSQESLGTCLTDERAIIIGSTGIFVEDCFCAPRDIEWALHKNKLYLLQARPITTLHIETDFELIHDQDTPQKTDYEYWTRANTGEVFLGATSPLGISLVVGGMDILSHRSQLMREKLPSSKFCPYYFHVLPVTHRQVTLSMLDTFYRANEKKITNFQKAFEVALFGRIVGTEEMHKAAVKRYGYVSRSRQFFVFAFLFLISFKTPKMIKKCAEKLKTYRLPKETFTNLTNIWNGLMSQILQYNDVSGVHGLATYLSSFYNLIVIHALAKGKDAWDSELYCDFANVLSSCTGIESADVPESLQELAQTIAKYHGTTFSSLTQQMAYDALTNDKGPAGKLFKEFLIKHGHRCIKEFDVFSKSWGMEPESLIPILQNLVASADILNLQPKKELSVKDEISKLKTPLPCSRKKLLSIILPWSRSAVRNREQTKSLVIKTVDWFRQTCEQMGKLMVEEGMLPDKELIYFLTLEEIKEMMETRRPGLVSKAIRRRRLQPKLDKLQFPEIIYGTPKPIEGDDDLSQYSSSFTLKGIPVCQGKVKGVARVVSTLSEASSIKNGDILITHSTDIGWSPYFPLLSGVVTVLGGLISHGAVVAREYGLPCVVGVQKAMSAFKSGDVVILDGRNGTISKLSNEDAEIKEV